MLGVALCGKPREVDPRLDVEFYEHMAQMCVHGVRRYEQPLGNLAIGQAAGYELSDGEF